jgi:tetratricopeptide (TPR) repeat protein
MPRYLLTGKDHRDRSVTEVVSAPDADEAVRRFKARGFADVTLHSDDVQGVLLDPKSLKNLTPAELLAVGRMSRPAFVARLVVKLYRQQWWLFALMLALIVGRRLLDAPWDLLDSLAVALLATPPVVVLLGEVFSPSRRFERAMAYNAWARWAEMLAALPPLRRAIPAPQYAFYEAKALAGLGRLEEALEVVRPYADDPKTPAWLYWGQLADVFTTAKLGDRVIECGEKAVEHAPDNVTVTIDLAMALLRYRRDTARARPLLERAREHEISDLILPFVLLAEGVLALEEKRPDRARKLLDESLTRAEKYRHTTALMGAAIDWIHTYLVMACAETGDPAAAEAHFRAAEPRLRAFGADDLLSRCQAALGHSAGRG